MPQLQAISLLDRESTPIAHSFVPKDILQPGNIGRVSRNSGVLVGEELLTISSRKTGRRIRTKIVLSVPVVQTQTISGISTPVVVRTGYAELNFTFDDTSTTQERNNLVGMLAGALGTTKTLVNDAVINGEGIY